jgi:phosphoserine aminotransferase
MSRVYNFSAGPAALPLEVLETIRNDIPDWQRTGMSVMEVSHRSKDFVALAEGRRYFADVDGADESRRLRRYR